MSDLRDIKPQTPIKKLDKVTFSKSNKMFEINTVSELVGMSPAFIKKVVGRKSKLTAGDVIELLDQDAFSETYVPRSLIPSYLLNKPIYINSPLIIDPHTIDSSSLFSGCALDLIERLPDHSVQCVVTSTPYWAMRLYDTWKPVTWADGDTCQYGMEQTPEGFIRHSVEILTKLKRVVRLDGSIWWNIMDTYNTRTQVRSNASEALNAMKGHDKTSWKDHDCRRYSAGHSYLVDGEQCLIPTKIAERASKVGYYVKSVISWAKIGSMPEPQNSRVSRNIEYVIHLALQRSPKFNKEAYRSTPASLGGRNKQNEPDKLSDYWCLPTSAGRGGHGAQFPLCLPGRCISLSSSENDVILDPFNGAGTSAIAARKLGRRYIGFDISDGYLGITRERLAKLEKQPNGQKKHIHVID